MTSRDRVLSTLARQPIDRTPRLLYEEAIGYTPPIERLLREKCDECEEQAGRERRAGHGVEPGNGDPKEKGAGAGWGKHPCGMKRMLCSAAILLPVFAPAAAVAGQAPPGDTASWNDQKLADYFRVQVGEIAGRCLADIRSLEDWQARRGEYRRRLEEMVGL